MIADAVDVEIKPRQVQLRTMQVSLPASPHLVLWVVVVVDVEVEVEEEDARA